jgi:hypothetical protein
VNESFQIIATLAAAQLVLCMAQGAGMARGTTTRTDRALAAALGRWPLELMWASIGLAAAVGLQTVASDDVLAALRLICGGHLLLLGAIAVRRSFADTRPTGNRMSRLGAAVTDPGTLPAYLSLFVTTGAGALGDTGQILAVLALPTLSFAWNALVALATAAPATPARARLRARHVRATPSLRLQSATGRG